MDHKIENFRINLDIYVNRVVPKNSNFIFTPISLKIFLMIEDGQNLSEIYNISKLDRESFDRAIIDLFRQGLIQKKVVEESYIGQDIIEQIKSYLATYVGPWGHLIFDDTLEVLGLSEERLPKLKLELLIDSIAKQIPSNKALEFKQSIKYLI
jgi:hypothetical protein